MENVCICHANIKLFVVNYSLHFSNLQPMPGQRNKINLK